MAVYTTLTEIEISDLLSRFALKGLRSFQGASAGIEITTYFLTLHSGAEYVLTVFEKFSAQSLKPYIQLTTQLNQNQLPVPCPLIDSEGIALQTVAQKPALLFIRSPGKHIEQSNPDICHQVGLSLAKIHAATATTSLKQLALANPCGVDWMKETLALVHNTLDKADITLLQQQIDGSAHLETTRLPRSIIHGDLFRDNVLIHNGAITAIIDFYHAGMDLQLIDLAITANDWCYAQSHEQAEPCVQALLEGYQSLRPLDSLEISSWHKCLCIAAARLWLSRQKRVVLAKNGGAGGVKDPNEYRSRLLKHLHSGQ